MKEWLGKIQECCSYMSDIITTVKGMAANLSTSSESEFTVEEALKRVQMFLKGKLVKNGCHLMIKDELPENTVIRGDVNNLVQVLNNLVDNACDAMEEHGGKYYSDGSQRGERGHSFGQRFRSGDIRDSRQKTVPIYVHDERH